MCTESAERVELGNFVLIFYPEGHDFWLYNGSSEQFEEKHNLKKKSDEKYRLFSPNCTLRQVNFQEIYRESFIQPFSNETVLE